MEEAPKLALFMERIYRSFEQFDTEAFLGAISGHPSALLIGTAPVYRVSWK